MILLWDPAQAHSLFNFFEPQFLYLQEGMTALFNPEDYYKGTKIMSVKYLDEARYISAQ